jgi:hypothetical protein
MPNIEVIAKTDDGVNQCFGLHDTSADKALRNCVKACRKVLTDWPHIKVLYLFDGATDLPLYSSQGAHWHVVRATNKEV